MMRIAAIILIALVACKSKGNRGSENKYSLLIKSADSVGISFEYTDSVTGSFRISTVYKKDKELINHIGDVFRGKEEACSCKSLGRINVYKQDSIVLQTDIALSEASGEGCMYLIFKEGEKQVCYRLSYNVGQPLSEYRDLMK
jgi:hypothetical protein